MPRALPRGAAALASRGFASTKPGPSAAAAATDPRTKLRRIVLTGAVALITVAGAVTGAKLKMDGDVVKERQQVLELPLDERIEMLQNRRAGLVAMRMPLERKLVGLRERMAQEKAEEARKEQGRA